MNTSIDSLALDRILKRLQDAKTEELSSILKSLIPKMVPLVNQGTVRDQVMAILTEALKRIKLHSIALEIGLFNALLGPSNLPFGCNFAIAFLDSLDSLELLNGVEDSSLSQLMVAATQHKAYSYQSNQLLFYTLKYSSIVNSIYTTKPELLLSYSTQLVDILGNFYLDFCILDRNILSNASAVAYGLGEERKERLLVKKKQLNMNFISSARMKLLECQFLPYHVVVAIVVACSCDSDVSVVSKSLWRLNQLKGSCFSLHTTYAFLLSLYFGLDSDYYQDFHVPKRLPFTSDHRIACLKFILDCVAKEEKLTVPLTDFTKVFEVVCHERNQLINRDQLDNQLRFLLTLMIKKFSCDPNVSHSDTEQLFISLEPLLDSWKIHKGHQSHGPTFRSACYDLISVLAFHFRTRDTTIVSTLLELAPIEAYSSDCASFFHALGKVHESIKEKGDSLPIELRSLNVLESHPKASCRIAFIQWLEVSSISISSRIGRLSALIDDSDEMVKKIALHHFNDAVGKYLDSISQTDILLTIELLAELMASYKKASNPGAFSKQNTLVANVDTPKRSLLLQSVCVIMKRIMTSKTAIMENYQTLIFDILSCLSSAVPENSDFAFNVKSMYLYNDERIEQGLDNFCSLSDFDKSFCSELDLAALSMRYAVEYASPDTLGKLYDTSFDCTLANWLLAPYRSVRGSISRVILSLSRERAREVYDKLHEKLDEYLISFNTSENINDAAVIILSSGLYLQCLLLITYSSELAGKADSYIQDIIRLKNVSCTLSDSGSSFLQNNVIEVLGRLGSCLDIFKASLISTSTLELADLIINADSLRSKDMTLVSTACMALTRLALIDSNGDIARRISIRIEEVMKDKTLNRYLALTLAESYVMIKLFIMGSKISINCSWLEMVQKLNETDRDQLLLLSQSLDILKLNENISLSSTSVHLVLDRALTISSEGSIDFDYLQSSLQFYLLALKSVHAFQQDLSCLGICHLYRLSMLIDDSNIRNIPMELANQYSSVANYIASAVAIVLTRERRVTQPVGFNSSSRGSGVGADTPSSRNTVQEPDNMEVDELLEAANEAGNADVRLLLNGIVTMNRDRSQALNQAEENSNYSHPENQYGVYGKICNIAKKSGENSIVILMLSLIRKDTDFCKGDTTMIYNTYKVDEISFSKDQVRKLLPMLFMGKNDPVAAVREIMKEIWQYLVSDTDGEVVNQYGDAITLYCADNLVNPKWRERESACSSLESVLLHRNWSFVKAHVELLLKRGFQVMDDLRESTRKSATVLMKALLSHVLNACNREQEEESIVQETISIVLPIFLEVGMLSPSVEARGFTLGALVNIIKTSKKYLLPWLEKLIDTFLESISALEPQLLQYMQFHVQSMKLSDEEWERNRLQLSQHSPMHEALQQCLELVDLLQIGSVCKILYHHLHSGVGLPTRVSAANGFSFLVEKFPGGMVSSGVQAFHLICTTLFERPHLSASLRSAMVQALGMLAKVVHIEALEDELALMIERYKSCSARDTDLALAITACTQQVIKKAGDRLSASDSIPLLISIAFVGMFDPHQETKSLWTDTFACLLDCTGIGAKVPALIKAADLICLSTAHFLLNMSWERRRQSINLIRDLLKSLSLEVLELYLGVLLAALFSQIKHMPWEGQDQAVECIAEILAKSPSHMKMNEAAADNLLDVPSLFQVRVGDVQDFLSKGSADLQGQCEELLKASSNGINVFTNKWTVNPATFLLILSHEYGRIESEYKFTIARAFSTVPWSKIDGPKELILQDLVKKLIDMAYLIPKQTKESEEINLSESMMNHSKPSPTAAPPVKKVLGNTALFGNRYGATPAPRILKRFAPTQLSKTNTEGVDIIVDNAPSSAQPTPGNSAAKSANGDTAGRPSAMDAAVRMFLLETLSSVWSIGSGNGKVNTDELDSLLLWMEACFAEEVWSVRKATVKLLGTIVTSTILSNAQLKSSLVLLGKAFLEPKYAKVRLEVLEALKLMIGGVNKSDLKGDHEDQIRNIARQAAADTQPSILEAASKIQHALLHF